MSILRTYTNKAGVEYDANNTEVLYAEDMNLVGSTLDSHAGSIAGIPVKATGAEVDTGTDDTKFVTPKAMEDSGYAKTSDIPSVPVKATGSEVDTGTNDTKFVTPKAMEDSNYVKEAVIWAYVGIFNTKVNLTDGATPALDASAGGVFRLSAGGNRTIAVPTNAIAGKKIVIEHYASGAARTLALNTGTNGFRFGSDITGLTETASGKTDYIGAIWNDTDSKWDVVAYVKGY